MCMTYWTLKHWKGRVEIWERSKSEQINWASLNIEGFKKQKIKKTKMYK